MREDNALKPNSSHVPPSDTRFVSSPPAHTYTLHQIRPWGNTKCRARQPPCKGAAYLQICIPLRKFP
jgi:hypothetical protein